MPAWLRSRRAKSVVSVVHALYVWYFGPLAAAIPLVVFDCYTEAAAIVVTVTALHMVIGGLMVVLGYTDLQTRYTDTRAIVADTAVTGACRSSHGRPRRHRGTSSAMPTGMGEYFLLDVSGSMNGARLDDAKKT